MTNGRIAQVLGALIILSVAAMAGGLWDHEGRLVATETSQGFILEGIEQINEKLDKLVED